jgi:hypothetical protein
MREKTEATAALAVLGWVACVRYETPANTVGLGTDFQLKKNAGAISGMAMLL